MTNHRGLGSGTPLWLAVPQKVVLKAEKRFSIHTWHLTVVTVFHYEYHQAKSPCYLEDSRHISVSV